MAKKSVSVDPETLVQLNPDDILMTDKSRYQDSVPADEAEAMRASILAVGRIMEPVGVTRLSPLVDGKHYPLRYGFRRVAGARLANAQGAGVTVPALVLEDADPQGVLREQVTENVVRKSLSLMDTAVAARKMLDAGIERAKELLDDPSLSDAEVEQIRDEFQSLVEIIFAKWKEERRREKNSRAEDQPAQQSPEK